MDGSPSPSDAADSTAVPDEPPGDKSRGELSAQLSLTIVGIEFDGIPLVEFADFVADFTALP